MVTYKLVYNNEKRFTKQRTNLQPKELAKLKKCLLLLRTEGPQIKFADNHIIIYDGEVFRSMDLSKAKRLTFSMEY